MQKLIYFYTLAIVVTLNTVGIAQEVEKNERASHLAIGFALSEWKSDLGLGLNITSPYFFSDTVAVRAHGDIAWFDGVPEGETELDWLMYISARLGFAIQVGMIGEHTRFYSEAGAIVLFPNDDMSDDIAIGGYGVFGFEFFTMAKSPVTYYLQAGGVGTNSNAEKLGGEPGFANGFLIEVGLRWYPY